MLATRALRQAAAHAERTPMIRFLGPRSIPCELSPLPAFPLARLTDPTTQ